MISYDQTVESVAAALDRAYPGWPDDVSLKDLDMGNASYMPGECAGCVAGQVGYHRHGDPIDGYDRVVQQLADMGGVTMAELSIAFGSGPELEQAWRDYLAPLKTRPPVAA
jgi:hypothetical protein